MNGVSGLDYNVLLTLMGLMNLPYEKHTQLFAGIRIVESEALHIMNTKDA